MTYGRQLALAFRQARKRLGFRQSDIALRLGRNPGRLAELEQDLLQGRSRRDRFQLFLEVAEQLKLVPVLVPEKRLGEVTRLLDEKPARDLTRSKSLYEELNEIPDDI